MRSPLALWSPVEVSRKIHAPRDEVFGAISDPGTYPDWLVGAQRIRSVDPAFPAPGTEFHHSVGPTGNMTVDDKTKAVAVEEDRRLVLDARAGPFRARVEFVLSAPTPSSTEVVLRERPTGPAALLTPVLRTSLAGRNNESLRQLEEHLRGSSTP